MIPKKRPNESSIRNEYLDIQQRFPQMKQNYGHVEMEMYYIYKTKAVITITSGDLSNLFNIRRAVLSICTGTYYDNSRIRFI